MNDTDSDRENDTHLHGLTHSSFGGVVEKVLRRESLGESGGDASLLALPDKGTGEAGLVPSLDGVLLPSPASSSSDSRQIQHCRGSIVEVAVGDWGGSGEDGAEVGSRVSPSEVTSASSREAARSSLALPSAAAPPGSDEGGRVVLID